MDDKKKMIILGALAVVIVGVGAFQFVKSGDKPAPAAPATHSSKEAKVTTPDKGTATTTAKQGEPAPGTLASGEAKDSAKTDANAKPTDEKLDPAIAAASKLAMRDPFDGRKWDQSVAKPTPPPPAQPQQRIPRPGKGDFGNTLRPAQITGVLPETVPNGGVPLPGGKMPSIDDFPYTVSGTVMGDRPCVVITENGSGQQKLVPVGGSIDGDSQVVSISKGSVTVRHHGKTKSFPVGGMNPSEKKDRG